MVVVNSKKINEILQHPQVLKSTDLKDLNEAIQEFPYFQALHAIHLKALKQNESFAYNQKLKETAAHTLDREVLFQFITNFNRLEQTKNQTSPQLLDSSSKKLVLKQTQNTAISTTDIEGKIENENKIEVEALVENKKTSTNESTSDTSVLSEHINPNTPLEFSNNERHSFSEWLKLTTAKPIDRTQEKQTDTEQKKTIASKKKKLIESPLIEKFLKTNPKIKPAKKANPTVNLAVTASTETDSLMTETLAKVYIAQKNYKKAIQAYKILSLKNPEKSGLFADQIRAIQKLQDSNS